MGGPALDLPALQVKKAGGDFSLGWSKVEVGGLIAVFVEEYGRVAVDDGAVLVVLEMLAPHRVILNVLLLSFHHPLQVVLAFIFFLSYLIVKLSYFFSFPCCQVCAAVIVPFRHLVQVLLEIIFRIFAS